jgi:hypothetical protein
VLKGHWEVVSAMGRKKGAENSRTVRGAKAIVDAELVRTLSAEGLSRKQIMDRTGFKLTKIKDAIRAGRLAT